MAKKVEKKVEKKVTKKVVKQERSGGKVMSYLRELILKNPQDKNKVLEAAITKKFGQAVKHEMFARMAYTARIALIKSGDLKEADLHPSRSGNSKGKSVKKEAEAKSAKPSKVSKKLKKLPKKIKG